MRSMIKIGYWLEVLYKFFVVEANKQAFKASCALPKIEGIFLVPKTMQGGKYEAF